MTSGTEPVVGQKSVPQNLDAVKQMATRAVLGTMMSLLFPLLWIHTHSCPTVGRETSPAL